jgi:hypothetical protein
MIERFPYYYRKGKIKVFNELSDASRTHIPIWTERMSKHPFYNDFDCYLFGSLVEEEKGRDLDIFFTGEYLPELLVDMMDTGLKIGLEMGIRTDVFYIPDFSYLDLPPNVLTSDSSKIFTSYDFEMEVVKGKISMFRDYGRNCKDGLFEFSHSAYHKKSLDRGQKKRYLKLN